MTQETFLPSHVEISKPAHRPFVVVILLGLATCSGQSPAPDQAQRTPARRTVTPIPSTEVAVWQQPGFDTYPEARFLQAVAFDEKRKVVVMFGGAKVQLNQATPLQDMWEWSPATGVWTRRPASGAVPVARSGAAMVFDPVRNKMLLFGGRAANHYNCEDLWEWDPPTGTWTERSGAGGHPSARAQHGMVYEASTGTILLYGGGRSEEDVQGLGVVASFGDTWELDPATGEWTELAPASSPGPRHDFGLVWDSARSKAVLFGGIQIGGIADAGTVMQDTWEWDPAAQTWTKRLTVGSQPSARYGHAMAFDGSRDRVVVFGGVGGANVEATNDMWDWEPGTGAWTQLLTGEEADLPTGRRFASMVFDAGRARIELVAGRVGVAVEGFTDRFKYVGSSEVWELDPSSVSFTDRSIAHPAPAVRIHHAMAYDPATDKTYVFGGYNPTVTGGGEFADLWEWDGAHWSKVVTTSGPSPRSEAAMAYDPVRKALILFGGLSGAVPGSVDGGERYGDTWEWSLATRQWRKIVTQNGPAPRCEHAMVTDTTRGMILMFGGSVSTPEGAAELWQWDGNSQTWTDRSPADSSRVPVGRSYPAVSFDEGLGKLIVYDTSYLSGTSQSSTSFWDWDVVTGGWAFHDSSDKLTGTRPTVYAVYDSARRRHVLLPDAVENGIYQTWELDAKSSRWYVRPLQTTPGGRRGSGMVYDSARRAVVLFGGERNTSGSNNETWEYTVTNLANGEGCTAVSAATCASGNCVDGVCCEMAGCSGACMACDVPGSEGTCVLAEAGTEVPGSCAQGQACDGAGKCKTKNGQPCSAATSCASGFCADGVCCDEACGETCRSCKVQGRIGICTSIPSGTDPDTECGQGTGVCKSSCDGVAACSFPLIACGNCVFCDGAGTCSRRDLTCVPGTGGAAGTGGHGGNGGSTTSGSGGGSGGGGTVGQGGAGGSLSGGSGGGTTASGGGGMAGGGGGATLPAVGGMAGGTSRDAGAGQGGAGGTTGSMTGTSPDSGEVKRDGGILADGGLKASLNRGGCSCEVGRSGEATTSWLLLVGFALLLRRARRLRARPTETSRS